MTGYGYELVDGQWTQVGGFRKGSFLVHSGTMINLDGPNDTGQWIITGRDSNGLVAVASLRPGSGRRRSISVRDLISRNPDLLAQRQFLTYRGEVCEVTGTEGRLVVLARPDADAQLVDPERLIAENLDALISRLVLIVDSG